MEGGGYYDVEWTIENFTCWNGELLGNGIESPICELLKLQLYPRGVDGRDRHMAVHMSFLYNFSSSGVLSYICSDGSTIWRQQVKADEKDQLRLELPPGPAFEEVVALIRKNEAHYGDRLVLRFRFRSTNDVEEHVRTSIDVVDTTLRIKPDLLMGGCGEEISKIRFLLNSSEYQKVFVKSVGENGKMHLQICPINFKECFSVQSLVSLMGGDDALEGYGEREHLFVDDTPWTVIDPGKMREIAQKRFTVLLHLRITRGHCSAKYSQKLYNPKRAGIVNCIGVSERKPSDPVALSNNPAEDSVTDLTKDLMCLYQDHDFSDFQLKCDNVPFPVHKVILSARSPVFKTMLSTDMVEAASGTVDITDLDASTLGLFLTYLYTGAVGDLQGESALNLYYAAEKYQVPSLKRECANLLCANISISNVCDILSFADKHKDDLLTKFSHDFILNHFNEVMKSEEWRSFIKSEPLLAVESVTYFGEKDLLRKYNPPQ